MVRKASVISSYFCKSTKLEKLIEALGLQPPSSLQPLLRSVVIATKHETNFFPNKYSLESVFSIEDILHRSIEYLCGLKQSNVLTFGYTFIREGYKRSCISGSNVIQTKATNTIVTYLKTRSWSVLHKLVGDDVMMHFLLHTSMFLSIEFGCFIQLCGVPLMDLKINETGCTKKCTVPKGRCTLRLDAHTTGSRGIKRKVQMNHDISATKKRRITEMLGSNSSKMSTPSGCYPPLLFTNNKTSKNDARTKPGEKIMPKENSHEKRKPTLPISYLHRSRIFYSMSYLEGFHQKHILNTLQNSNSAVYTLLNTIFKFDKRDLKIKRIPKHLNGLKDLMKIAIGNFKRTKLRKILNFYCPIPKWARTVPRKWLRKGVLGGSKFQNKVYYKFAVRAFVPIQKVYLFIRHILCKVFPPLIWGSIQNKKKIVRVLLKFLSLDRYERFSLSTVMLGVKITHFSWLVNTGEFPRRYQNVQSTQKKLCIVRTLICWVFNDFIVPLLRGCFYVTESSCHRNKVFYYRKPIWRIVRGLGLRPLLGSLFKPIDKGIVQRKLETKECAGVHPIRLLPGQKKLRPIANMCSSIPTDKMKKISINNELRVLHLALRYENHFNRNMLGVSVSSAEQIYEKWRHFTDRCKSIHNEAVPKLYFISLDISRCFDTLPQDQILKLVPLCLQEEAYQIRKFVKLKMGQNCCVSRKYVSIATDSNDCSHFVSFIRNCLKDGRIVAKKTVFIDKVYYRDETRENLLMLLRKHVTCSIGYIGDRYVLQKIGIAQGSILATTLNNIHYGNIEDKYLVPYFQSPDSIFMRWVDDYMFVTTSKMMALKFLEAMHTKMPKYGCNVNQKKTMLNFELSTNGKKFSCLKGDWFPWCGYMFNHKTLECSFNYVQYAGENIGDGMTLEYVSHTGTSMVRKLVLAVCLKATPLIVDFKINSTVTIHKNVYQVFRFAALKFLVHSKVLRRGQAVAPHLPFYFNLVKKLPLKFWKVLRNNFQKSRRNKKDSQMENVHDRDTVSSNNQERLSINRRVVKVLCYQAFVDTLRPRQSLYGRLTQLLIYQLKVLRTTTSNVKINEIREHSNIFKMVKI